MRLFPREPILIGPLACMDDINKIEESDTGESSEDTGSEDTDEEAMTRLEETDAEPPEPDPVGEYALVGCRIVPI